ncbi:MULTISPECIES: adenylate/guanylate cyclase domain-containing protein [unclassified Brevibacterium]|uniref:adenylate/guanylate cyclase domain-containing protein n=1 Tax=unclassified Brevibacterium TaxID=2614124 RepID=UPI001F109512|nr:adenylate/guanylate cyclase domain-containing protein [Brevibacterium sp. S111]
MAVSDFTAGFDIVDPEKLGTAEVGAADSRDEVSQSQNTGGQAEDRAASPSDMEADVDEAAAGASDSTSAEPRAAESGESDPDVPVDEAPASSTESGNRSGTRAEADSATDSASDSASEAGAPFEPNSIPVITEDRPPTHSADDSGPQGSAAAASVPGIEYGDDDLVRGIETTDASDSAGRGAGETNTRADDEEDFFSGLREDPRTSAMPTVEDDDGSASVNVDADAPDFDDTIYETRTAAERLEEILLDGKRVLDRREAAKLGGISTVSARKMWRALGMSQANESDKAYTVSDAHALRIWAKPVADGLIDQTTALSLARAIGQTTDRLVVWQMETLVEFLTEEKGLTDPEARRDALQVVEDMIDPLQKMLTYSWRRNLADVMGRLNVNVSDGLAMDNRQGWYDSSMPLARAVGFIDLVSFTRLSQKMEPRQLANMVQEFQGMAYNIVATGGGRVIKTVGDEVFFAASTPLAGAEIAMTLMERVTAAEDLPQARVGFVWGRVLSRLGDIFGSSVNLAARLTAVADPGTIFTDEETARVLSASDDYVYEPRDSISLHGLGETSIGEMKRGTATRMRLDLDDEGEG